jgi:hypothetical protein
MAAYSFCFREAVSDADPAQQTKPAGFVLLALFSLLRAAWSVVATLLADSGRVMRP